MIDIYVDADQRYLDTAAPELAADSPIPRDVVARWVERGRVLVVTEGDTVKGWVLLIRSQGELCIGQISVSRADGQRGLGTRLLQAVIKTARERGEESIVLNTERDFAWNEPWYAKHGFVVVPEPEWTDDMRVIAQEQSETGLDWSRRVHMRLDLSTAADLY